MDINKRISCGAGWQQEMRKLWDAPEIRNKQTLFSWGHQHMRVCQTCHPQLRHSIFYYICPSTGRSTGSRMSNNGWREWIEPFQPLWMEYRTYCRKFLGQCHQHTLKESFWENAQGEIRSNSHMNVTLAASKHEVKEINGRGKFDQENMRSVIEGLVRVKEKWGRDCERRRNEIHNPTTCKY